MKLIFFLLTVVYCLLTEEVSAYNALPFNYDHYLEVSGQTNYNGLYETVEANKRGKRKLVLLERFAAGHIIFKRENYYKQSYISYYYYDTLFQHLLFEQQYSSEGLCIFEIKYHYDNDKLVKMSGTYLGHFYELELNYDDKLRILSQNLLQAYNDHTIEYYEYKDNITNVFIRADRQNGSILKRTIETDSLNHIQIKKYFFYGELQGLDSFFYDPIWKVYKISYIYLSKDKSGELIGSSVKTFQNFKLESDFRHFLDKYILLHGHISKPKVLEMSETTVKINGNITRTKQIKQFSANFDLLNQYNGLFLKDVIQ